VPPARTREALPLVIVLHGGGGNAENAARTAQMERRADRDRFFVVYPTEPGA
jgi:polyhydroxybutyrate depolymerase